MNEGNFLHYDDKTSKIIIKNKVTINLKKIQLKINTY